MHVKDFPAADCLTCTVALNDLDQCHNLPYTAYSVNNQSSGLLVELSQGQSTGPSNSSFLKDLDEFHFMNDDVFTDYNVHVHSLNSVCHDDVYSINPSPLSRLNDADVVVYNNDDGVGTQDVYSSLDNAFDNDICNYNDDEFNFVYLNHLFSCSIVHCKFCIYIYVLHSFHSFI
jgi:hypothetical protein